MPRDLVRVLEAAPELGEGLTTAEFAAASSALRARTVDVPVGAWAPDSVYPPRMAGVGLLIVDGLVTRTVGLGARPSLELFGRADLLRPVVLLGIAGLSPAEIGWHVLEPARVAVLDDRFLAAAVRWPGLVSTVLGRLFHRQYALAFRSATKQLTHVEDRLLLMLWGMSERWGHVTPDGVELRLRLTHEQLGRLVGARRPAVTTALGRLAAEGLVERVDAGFLLHGEAEEAMRRVGAVPWDIGIARP